MNDEAREDRSKLAGGDAGVPNDEIEVTPEMVHAGVMRYYDFDKRFYDKDEILAKVFIAMWKLRPARS